MNKEEKLLIPRRYYNTYIKQKKTKQNMKTLEERIKYVKEFTPTKYPFSFCIGCSKVGMRNCAHFDECGGPITINNEAELIAFKEKYIKSITPDY